MAWSSHWPHSGSRPPATSTCIVSNNNGRAFSRVVHSLLLINHHQLEDTSTMDFNASKTRYIKKVRSTILVSNRHTELQFTKKRKYKSYSTLLNDNPV